MGRKPNCLENILSRTIRDEESGCLLYTGAVNEKGYPRISSQGKMRIGSDVVYEMWYGAIPDGCEIDHTCYNRRCIERTHLRPLTHKENIIRTERYEILRDVRLHVLLALYPQIEFFPITITSVELRNLWGCQSYNVAKVLHTMTDAYPAAFVWRPLRKGRQGRKPAIFELQITSSLADKLLNEEEEVFTSVVETLVG